MRHRAPALLAIVAWSAVLLQLWLSIQLALANGRSVTAGLVAYLGYFTVLTNIFVAVVATAGAVYGSGREPPSWYRASVVGCATTAIVVVGLGYHLLLREIWSPQGAALLADTLLHYVVPIGALLHWLVYRDSATLGPTAPLAWCGYPVAYFAYAMLRGAILGVYPYPFIDVTTIGYGRALLNACGLLIVFVIVGYATVGLGRLEWRRAN